MSEQKPKNKPLYVVGKPDGLVEPGNIDVANRPSVQNGDGSVSTVRSMGVNIGGKEVLLPTVSDDGRVMSDDEAVRQYEKTGQHLGVFKTPEHSNAYAEALHNDQEQAGRAPTMEVPFYGPTSDKAGPRHPWEEWAPERVAALDRALEGVDMAKNYREAGAMAVNAPKAAEHYAELAQSGGLTRDQATTLARYRMWKMGMPNVPMGERAPDPTPEQIDARRDAFMKADRADRQRMLDEDKLRNDHSHQAYFDALVGPGPQPTPNITPEKIEAARKVVSKNRRARPTS